LSAANLDTLAARITDKTFDPKHLIFKEGKETEAALYIVREGVVKISTSDKKRSEKIMAGGYFGQDLLLADASGDKSNGGMIKPQYTAKSTNQKCICGVLTLKECRRVFDTSHLGEEDYEGSTAELLSRRDALRSTAKSSMTLDSLDRKEILGEGQFGEVWLVTADSLGTNQEFALKIQAKDDPVRKDNVIEAIKREMTVVKQLNHPCIVALIDSYEDEDYIYMLLEAVKGGELWSVIHQEDASGNWTSGMDESQAKFYALVVADTLAYMHRQKFIFRDLKPENVLIDPDGYPTIVDFGFAKYCPDKTHTFCGTPNYLAPEIVTNRGHGGGVDHWALGVVTYEMITGENPFYFEDMDQMSLFQAIVQEPFYPLPDKTSPELVNLMTGLLEKDPAQRLGMLAGRERDILKHKWFAELDLIAMRNKSVEAPYLPPMNKGS